MFINFTNHPSAQWSAEQKAAAQAYGEVIDLAFPAIDPATNEAVLDSLAAVYADHILHLSPDAVLCQGECTFVYRVVQRLEAAGIPTLASRAFTLSINLARLSGDHLPGRQHPEAQHLRLCRLPPLWLTLKEGFLSILHGTIMIQDLSLSLSRGFTLFQ